MKTAFEEIRLKLVRAACDYASMKKLMDGVKIPIIGHSILEVKKEEFLKVAEEYFEFVTTEKE